MSDAKNIVDDEADQSGFELDGQMAPNYAPVVYPTPVSTNPYHSGYDQYDGIQQQHPIPVLQQLDVGAGNFGRSDLTIPALLVTFFCCFCTGIAAVVYAGKAQTKYQEGNLREAEDNQKTAKQLILASICMGVTLCVISVILMFAVFGSAIISKEDQNY